MHSRYGAGRSKRDEYGSLSLRKLKTRRRHTPTPFTFKKIELNLKQMMNIVVSLDKDGACLISPKTMATIQSALELLAEEIKPEVSVTFEITGFFITGDPEQVGVMIQHEEEVESTDIIISKTAKYKNGYDVRVGNKSTEGLTWDELMGLFIALTYPDRSPCLTWLKTDEQREVERQAYLAKDHALPVEVELEEQLPLMKLPNPPQS